MIVQVRMKKEIQCFILYTYTFEGKAIDIASSRSKRRFCWSRWYKRSYIVESQCSFLSFALTLCRKAFYVFLWYKVMRLLSFKWWEIWDSNRLSCRHCKSNLWLKKSKKPLVLWLHIVIHLEMKVDILSKLFFRNSREKVLKNFYIFSVLTDKEGRIRSFNINIQIVTIFYDSEWINLYSEALKKWLCKCFHVAYYIEFFSEFNLRVITQVVLRCIWKYSDASCVHFLAERGGFPPFVCRADFVGHSHSGGWHA